MQNSKIEWTDHTFNPWWGCQRVSPGCQNCYAETLAHRYGHEVWGPARTTPRRAMSDNYWKQPIRWNKAAEKARHPARVFCASMADVFEDHPQVAEWRQRLWHLIEETPWLTWLLLTKRPENIRRMIMPAWLGAPPPNIWYGTSCEDQQRADERIPHLLRVPARVRFLSCEPLLGAIDLTRTNYGSVEPTHKIDVLREWYYDGDTLIDRAPANEAQKIHWLIVGGESGHGAGPMHPDWARGLRDQAQAAGVAFFFKQWGQFAPPTAHSSGELAFEDGQRMRSIGKRAAGRLLDGTEHNAYPV